SRAQSGFLRQLQEELERFVSDAILGVIERDAHSFNGETLAAFGILGEELPEMQFPHVSIVGFERLPGPACRKRLNGDRHVRVPFVSIRLLRRASRGTLADDSIQAEPAP